MYLVVGLGNPSPTYDGTRHNIGVAAVQAWLQTHGDASLISVPGITTPLYRFSLDGKDVIACAQLGCFMNESGQAMERIRHFFKLTAADIIVVHDELAFPLGTLRIAHNAGPAGHNGVESVTHTLGTNAYTRLRLGVETRASTQQPPNDAFVLQKFSDQELPLVTQTFERATEALTMVIAKGRETAMTNFNR